MSRLVLNRDGGSADEYGHLLPLARLMTGEVVQGLKVTQDSGSNMFVRVPAGLAGVPIGTSPSNYREWVVIDTSGTGEQLAITTANSSNPRNDLIVLYVDRSVTPSTATANNPNNMLKLATVAGTPNASPVDPTVSAIQTAIGAANPYIVVARVRVAAAVTQITNAAIDDLRKLAFVGSRRVGLNFVEPGTILTTSYVSQCTVTGVSSGSEVELLYMANVHDGNSGAARSGHIRVQCDGVTVPFSDRIYTTPTSGAYANAAGSISHTPTPGPHTWTLQCEADTASATFLDDASLKVTEVA